MGVEIEISNCLVCSNYSQFYNLFLSMLFIETHKLLLFILFDTDFMAKPYHSLLPMHMIVIIDLRAHDWGHSKHIN